MAGLSQLASAVRQDLIPLPNSDTLAEMLDEAKPLLKFHYANSDFGPTWFYLVELSGLHLFREQHNEPIALSQSRLGALKDLLDARRSKNPNVLKDALERRIPSFDPGLNAIRDALGDPRGPASAINRDTDPSTQKTQYRFRLDVKRLSKKDFLRAAQKYSFAVVPQGRKKTPPPFIGLLTVDAWADAKRFKWISGPTPIETGDTSGVLDSLRTAPQTMPWHAILIGPIASGKTSVTLNVLRWVQKNRRFSRVLVLPLGLDFAVPNFRWSRERAIQSLNAALEEIPSQDRAETLIVVEDVHETARLESVPWNDNGEPPGAARLLKSFSVLFTCRAPSHSRVIDALATRCGIELARFELHPVETAEALINHVVNEDLQYVKQAITLFGHSGFSLITLVYALDEWRRSGCTEALTMRLAHRAVFAQLDAIAGEVSANDEIREHVRCLALVWLLGGLDTPVDVDFLATYFGASLNPHRFWTTLVHRHEVAENDGIYVPPRRYVSLRHPAWGQLVMHALDATSSYQEATGTAATIVQSFVRSDFGQTYKEILVAPKYGRLKPSTCLLMAILAARKGASDEKTFAEQLAFYCSGQFLYEEFVHASLRLTEIDRVNGEDELTVCEKQLAMSANARKATPVPWTADKGYAYRDAGRRAFRSALGSLRQRYGDGLIGYPGRGSALYEDAYYDFRFGHLDDALRKMTLSIQVETAAGEPRRAFAAMSTVVLSRIYAAQGASERALTTSKQALDMLSSMPTSGENRVLILRFLGNAAHAVGEAFLSARSSPEDVATFFSRSKKYFDKAGLTMWELNDSRVSLAKGDGEAALSQAQQFISNLLNTKSDEGWERYYRILGDAHALVGDRNQALENYEKTIPTIGEELSPDARTARARSEGLKAGRSASQILRNGIL